jgi:hypothetical protein
MNDEKRNEAPDPTPLDAWGTDWTAPPALRQATLRAARERGLVKGGFMTGRAFGVGLAAAAAALTFVVGFGLGARQPGKETAVTEIAKPADVKETTALAHATQPKFALFLFEDANYQSPDEAHLGERIGEYSAWARSIGEKGRFVTGEKLADDGKFCRIENGTLTAAGPQSDAKRGALTGYFVVGAQDLDEAMAIAKTCPHLKYGGTVEIRRLEG